MATDFRGVPGSYTGQQVTDRNIFVSNGRDVQYYPSSAIIDGTYSRDTGSTVSTLLRAGTLVGKDSTSLKYRPSIIGLVTAAYTSGGTSLTVNAAVATEVARLIALNGGSAVTLNTIGPPAAAGTVAITSTTCSAASGTTLTVTSLGVNKAAGSIIAPSGGAQLPIAPLCKRFGIDVIDTGGNLIDQPLVSFLRGADLLTAMLPNVLADDFGNSADTSVTTWVKAQLKAIGYYTFNDDR
jgi:hypothetical protein